MEKAYRPINWQNSPSTSTALSATNLNRLETSVDVIDNRVIQLDTQKLNIATANSMIAAFTIDPKSGVIIAKQLGGTVMRWDLNLEKIPAKLSLTADAVLVLQTDDGQSYTADLKGLIDTYTFQDSGTVAFSATSSKEISGEVKRGSITGDHLATDYLGDITEQQLIAAGHKDKARQYADAAAGSETAAQQYAEQAANDRELTQQIAAINMPHFSIDFSDGQVVVTGGNGLNFYIDSDGCLNSEVILNG